jgi:hypothetical protein
MGKKREKGQKGGDLSNYVIEIKQEFHQKQRRENLSSMTREVRTQDEEFERVDEAIRPST